MSSPQLRFERRLRWFTFLVGLPGVTVAGGLLWLGEFDARTRWTLLALVGIAWLALGAALVQRVVFPLQTLANLLGGLREGDFSTRARGAIRDDALGEVLLEANALAETLREQRLGALEATALLRAVMEELDAAVFAFDDQQRVRLVNRAAEALLRRPGAQLLERTALELGLAGCLFGEPQATLALTFPGAAGRFGVRRTSFRQAGRPHQLLVLTDLSRALREEERQAWQRLVRVLGHELNNSLAPIKSLAGSVETILGRNPLPEDWREDSRRALGVIGSRAEALTRFMDAYSRLAKLPLPRLASVDLGDCVARIVAMEPRVPVAVMAGPAVTLGADADQLEQLLINLLRNAAEATIEAGKLVGDMEPVTVAWRTTRENVLLSVTDGGIGLASSANLFVPFFTTKATGSGIGLTLCRQIAENHGGSLTLTNREGARGCVATLTLPVH